MSLPARASRHQLALSAILVATFLVYARVLAYPAISWDDPEMVFRNDDVQRFDAAAFFTHHYVGNWLPLTMLVHAVTWLLSHEHAAGFHFVNIALHLLNGWLVYRVALKLRSSEAVAILAAGVFLLHPVQAESVAWISELKTVLCATFCLLALQCFVTCIETARPLAYWLSLALLAAACMSKPAAVALPLAFAALCFLRDARQRIFRTLPHIGVAVITSVVTLKTQAADHFINHSHEFPFMQRIGMAGFALLKYVQLIFLPVKLSVVYPFPAVNALHLALGALALIAVIAAAWLLIRSHHLTAAFACIFALAFLGPVLQLVPFGEVLYADRYLYIPLLGGAILAGTLLSRIPSAAAVVILAALGVAAFQRTGAWRDSLTLFRDIDKKYPGQFLVLNSAGVACMFADKDDEALAYFNDAVKAAPYNYKSYYNRGLLYLKRSEPRAAIRSFNEALALYDYPKAYAGRAAAWYALGDREHAASDARKCVTMDAGNARGWFVYGNVLSDEGKLHEAVDAYSRAIALDRREADFLFRRAIAEGKLQAFGPALTDFDRCLELRPGDAEAHFWRAVALQNLGRDPCEELSIAARLGFEKAGVMRQKYCR